MNVKDYKDIYGRNRNLPVKRREPKTVNVKLKPLHSRKLIGNNKKVRVAKKTNQW